MKVEYLIFNLIIFLASTIAVIVYKNAHFPQFKSAILAILSLAFPYIIWDSLVTGTWWHFNPMYIIGPTFAGLPLEEWLFFLVVPWATLLLWCNFPLLSESKKLNNGWLPWVALILVSVWIAVQSLYGLTVASLFLILVIFLGKRCLQSHWIMMMVLTLILTAICNAYLTWRPVVIYQENAISGLRLGTIPIEDFYYGLVLVLGVTYVYERIKYEPK